jgi:hypothetical protein
VQKVLKLHKLRGKRTTTNRRSAKILTISRVFLLTGFSHPSILQLQIRGTWKRHTDRVETKDGPARTETARFLAKISSAKCLFRACKGGGASAVRPTANKRPQRRFGVSR